MLIFTGNIYSEHSKVLNCDARDLTGAPFGGQSLIKNIEEKCF